MGLPVVVRVRTVDWPHWGDEITEHAVVVVGNQAQRRGLIYINDPFFAQGTIEMSLIAFEAGWIEGEGYYAIIRIGAPYKIAPLKYLACLRYPEFHFTFLCNTGSIACRKRG